MQIRTVRDLDALAEHGEAWNRLAERAPQGVPMISWAWVSAYLRHRLGPEESWLAVLAFDGDDLVGVLPLIDGPREDPWPHLRVLTAPRDPHTICGDALAAPGREHEILPALVEAALDAVPDAARLDLERVPSTSPTVALARPSTGPVLWTRHAAGRGGYLAIRGDFEGYRADLSSNFRSNLNKARRKLDRLDGVRYSFLHGDRADPADLDRFLEVEADNWKGREGTAIACSPDLVAFYRDLVGGLAEAGWLEWQFLEADGRDLAANLAVRIGGRVVLWKLGYRDGDSKCAPGNLLLEACIERAFEEGLREVDMMTDHAFYERWNMRWRTYQTLHGWAGRPRALLLGYLPERAGRWARESARGTPLEDIGRRVLGGVRALQRAL
ncbi:MAG: GNAT family N-acetyltransferase [Myxococcota bacterium]